VEKKNQKRHNQDKDFTEINKLLANVTNIFKMKKLIAYYYFNKAKNAEIKKKIPRIINPC
jgi:hypothetical protein